MKRIGTGNVCVCLAIVFTCVDSLCSIRKCVALLGQMSKMSIGEMWQDKTTHQPHMQLKTRYGVISQMSLCFILLLFRRLWLLCISKEKGSSCRIDWPKRQERNEICEFLLSKINTTRTNWSFTWLHFSFSSNFRPSFLTLKMSQKCFCLLFSIFLLFLLRCSKLRVVNLMKTLKIFALTFQIK